MRNIFCAMLVLLVAACAPSVHPSRRVHGTLVTSTRTATVCELAHWGRDMEGARVRVRAEYFTDLRYGAFLSDWQCPSARLELASDSASADKSVSHFNDVTAGHDNYYVNHKFKVDVTGTFEWSEGRIINKDLPPDRQYRIPPHGLLALMKVPD